jgi:hypothetical protein
MSYETNRPTYLKRKLQNMQDKLYSRQPQLMNRLEPFLDKAEEIDTEPILSSPTNPLSESLNVEPLVLSSSCLNGIPTISKKRKISEVKRKTLWVLK